MFYESILNLYRKFRLLSYRDIFQAVQEKNGSLSATEAFSADVINLLHQPTVTQFADYIGISQPNATYKVNNLVAKGYIRRVHGGADRRECRLEISDRFVHYYRENVSGLEEAVGHLREEFSEQELGTAARVLNRLAENLDSKLKGEK